MEDRRLQAALTALFEAVVRLDQMGAAPFPLLVAVRLALRVGGYRQHGNRQYLSDVIHAMATKGAVS